MGKKYSLGFRMKLALVIGLAAIVSAVFGGCSPDNKLIDKNLISKPYLETTFLSDDVRKHGKRLGGQARRDFIKFNLNKNLSAHIWQNYLYEENDFNERDFGVNYRLPVNDRLSLNAGFTYWDFVSGTLGDHEHVFNIGANYSGPVDLSFCVEQMLKHGETPGGVRYSARASKSFPLNKSHEKGDWNISFRPSISLAGTDNFFDRTSTISQITPGVSVSFKKGNFVIEGFVNHQTGPDGTMEDLTYSGLRAGWQF